jgi:hypothetical protein
VRAYSVAAERAIAASPHVHPWHYYIGLLLHFPAEGTPFWTEASILALALVGGIAAWRGAGDVHQRALRLLSVYTLLMLVAYSAIPYKTPWCLLGFLHGMILLAGKGAVVLVRGATGAATRGTILALVAAAMAHLGWQAWAASFRFAADPRNPYVYAHTGEDVFEIVSRLERLCAAHPDGPAMPLSIVSRDNLWPLPFYLRRMTNVAWWDGVANDAKPAPVVMITPDMEPALVRRLYETPPPGERELYVRAFDRPLELRPGLELRAYAAASLWERYVRGTDEAWAGGRAKREPR